MHNAPRIGRIFGIEVRVHPSWLIVFVLVTWSLATAYFPQQDPAFSTAANWLLGAISALLLFAAVLLHELSHSLVAKRRGLGVDSITLFVFGGVSALAGEPRRPGTQFLVAAAGPVMSLIVAGVAFGLSIGLAGVSLGAAVIFGYLATVNVLLAVFNLIPGFPLDGGRVLQSVIWQATGDPVRATRIAGGIGQVVAYLFIFWGLWQMFTGNFVGGLWIAFIGWFLLSAAGGTVRQLALEEQLSGLTVGDIMRREPVSVAPGVSVEEAVERYLLAHNLRAVPVVDRGRLIGIVTLADIRHLPHASWTLTHIGDIVDVRSSENRVTQDESLAEALRAMAASGLERLPVVRDGELVGVLSRSDVARYLQLRLSVRESDRHSGRRLAA
ncbi:MAG: CBS domain-containing protein [Chloroflexota bacterium]